jgi:CspA family cold shock protein
MSKLTGVVKFFSVDKGFGFIKENGSETEYFTHATGLIDKIYENDEVSFDIVDGKKGKNAINVEVIG